MLLQLNIGPNTGHTHLSMSLTIFALYLTIPSKKCMIYVKDYL